MTSILTPLIRYIALHKGFVDCPQRARKIHEKAIPRLGGAAILLAFLIVVLVATFSVPFLGILLYGITPTIGAIILGSVGVFTIGLYDDLSRLSARFKLIAEFLIAGLVVWGANLSFTSIQFLGVGTISIPEWFGFGLSCLWIVGMANAINLIDGLDGLASGITLTGLLAVSVVAYLSGITPAIWMSSLLIGCLLGFLVYNSRPASIFLGDCGSLTLGYLCGTLSLLASFRGNGLVDGIFPVLAFAVPVTDCFFAIFRRIMGGRSPFSPDMEHFHHRLMAKGFTHGRAVLALWTISLCCSLLAIASSFGKADQLFAVFVCFGFGVFILLRYLGYFRFEFFGEGLSTLMQDRQSTKSVEQSMREAEQIVSQANSLDELNDCLRKAALGLQFHKAKLSFYFYENRLGSKFDNLESCEVKMINWEDSEQPGYYSRDQEFTVEFPLTGRKYTYGKAEYTFVDGRNNLSVQDEVLLECVHDAISNLAARVRKNHQVS